MMHLNIIIEIDDTPGGYVHMKYHRFKNAPFNYRQAMSWNAFAYGMKKRNISEDRFYWCQRVSEWEERNKVGMTYVHSKKTKKIPVVIHDDLWAFYKYVGYDHKTNKWSKK